MALYNPPEFNPDVPPSITTAIVDSIAADTIAPHILTRDQAEILFVRHWADSVFAANEYAEAHAGSVVGVEPQPLPPAYGRSTPLACIAALMLFLLGITAGSVHRAFKAYYTDLVSVRRRPNAFDDFHKAPMRAAIVLALSFIVFGGIALYSLTPSSASPSFAGAAICMLVLAAYYIFQLCAYSVVGYAFASADGRRMWVEGFCSSQAFAGLALIVPALLLVFVPEWKIPLSYTCVGIYVAARLVFLWKGIRIFFEGVRSLLYFILYLCTQEIIPLFAVYTLSCRYSGIAVF